MERRRFKQALSDERARFAEAMDKEQVAHRRALKEAKAESNRQAVLALAENSRGGERESLRDELESVKGALEEERESARISIADLQDTVRSMRRQLVALGGDPGPDVESVSRGPGLERHHLGGGGGEFENIASALKEKDSALHKLHREHKRLQMLTAAKSPPRDRSHSRW